MWSKSSIWLTILRDFKANKTKRNYRAWENIQQKFLFDSNPSSDYRGGREECFLYECLFPDMKTALLVTHWCLSRLHFAESQSFSDGIIVSAMSPM